jgi:hypothetical protein
VARRPLEKERISLDGGRRTTQLMRDSLGRAMKAHMSHPATSGLSITLCLVLLASCGPSREEHRRAVEDTLQTIRFTLLHTMNERDIQSAKKQCHESTDQLRALLIRDSSLTVQFKGQREPVLPFAGELQLATARHDSTMSCAGLVDSVARAMHAERAIRGNR